MKNETLISPREDLENIIAAIMEAESLPRTAAIAGAQVYALAEARDIAERADFYDKQGFSGTADRLRAIAREYRTVSANL
jgi:hypothetical protein